MARRSSVGVLALPGGDRTGRLTLDALRAVVRAAAALAGDLAMSSAGGRLVEEKNRLVLALTATVPPQADLRAVIHACDDVAAHVLHSTGRRDLSCRVRVKVAARARSAPRVR